MRLPATTELASRIVFGLRTVTTTGSVEQPNARDAAARARALALIERMLHTAIERARAVAHTQPAGMGAWSKNARDDWKRSMDLVDTISRETFFASGAYDARGPQRKGEGLSPAEARWYIEAADIIDALTSIGLPTVAHHVLETLEHFVDIDPRGVFMRMVATVKAGHAWGYQYDRMAEGLVVGLIDRYIAEHRTLLQQDPECCSALVDILDIFVRAGWQSAHRITYGLNGIYR